jgi:hypothetical protein
MVPLGSQHHQSLHVQYLVGPLSFSCKILVKRGCDMHITRAPKIWAQRQFLTEFPAQERYITMASEQQHYELKALI